MKDILKVFYDYVSNYDFNNEHIKRKYDHSIRVMNLSKKYAEILGFSEEETYIATLIGLLHDIGRFEQLKVYGTYKDNISIDHADYGVKILFDDGLIKSFCDNEEYYELIKFSIKNHNKLEIEPCNIEEYIKFAKLIRDVDKLDIIYIYGILDEYKIRTVDDEISKEIKDCFYRHETILYSLAKNKNDYITFSFAYVFDINNDVILHEIKDYYKEFYKKLDYKFEDIFNETIKYIDERIDKNVRH